MMESVNDPDDWDGHWDQYAASAAINPAQTLRHDAILRALRAAPWPAPTLLDIGSGQGDFITRAMEAGAAVEYVGFELSASGVRIAQAKSPRAKFFEVNLLAPSDDAARLHGWASVAVCSDVIEHVDDPVGFLNAAREYLRPGATLVLTVPGGPMSQFDLVIGHRRHFDPTSIRSVLTSAGFDVERVVLPGFPFFNLYRLMVILRGSKLADDVSSGGGSGEISGAAVLAMKIFSVLFRLNLPDSLFGWQVVAIAKKPN